MHAVAWFLCPCFCIVFNKKKGVAIFYSFLWAIVTFNESQTGIGVNFHLISALYSPQKSGYYDS